VGSRAFQDVEDVRQAVAARLVVQAFLVQISSAQEVDNPCGQDA